ncbi:complement factor H-like [Gouania willdenowi]|uniref:complement factor H-like n=1 Tax=Gouania willdenowi TaxID=441366 RepID=UPI001056CFAD|nr:complement factor H-like [Gouania willdenowi]
MIDSLVREERMDMLFRISIFLLCLTFVKSQDCTLQDFLNSNKFDKAFETANMKERYANEHEVIVPCQIGYNGYFKLICKDGTWDSIGDKCQVRSCGHPGQAEFADFHLEKGKDFVFSSKVIYTCHKGYHMASYRNDRRCMDEGWDGTVPICEPTYCPVINVDQSLRVDGNMEEATYGTVIQFKCHSPDQALYGASEIYCEENGEWKGDGWEGQPPKCDVIKCTHQGLIENGFIENNVPEYYKDQTLHYKCHHGFQPRRMSSVCSVQGVRAAWSIMPVCEAVRCNLKYKPIGTSIDTNKNVFSPGEKVTINCEEKYKIGINEGTSATIVCMENGDWSIPPQCTEVICTKPQDWRVSMQYFSSSKMDETVSYSCKTGYKTNGVTHAKCTRDGWTPKPLCIEKKHCSDPIVTNGFFQRPNQKMVFYSCDEGYKLFTKGWWASAECKDGEWSKIQECIENTTCGEPPVIPHGKANIRNIKNQVQELQITCERGYLSVNKQISCVNGEWVLNEGSLNTVCEADAGACGPPPRVENAFIKSPYQKKYVTDSTVTYECRQDYTLEEDATIRCTNGEWETKAIRCIRTTSKVNDVGPNPTTTSQVTALGPCGKPPTIDDGIILAGIKEQYKENDKVKYGCPLYYTIEGEPYKTCINGEWIGEISCNKPCTVDRDAMNRQNIEFKYSRHDKMYSEHNDEIEFRCKRGMRTDGQVAMRQRCVHGVINLPTCSE